MNTISLGQIFILLFLILLIFGDFSKILSKLSINSSKNTNKKKMVKKARKKGI